MGGCEQVPPGNGEDVERVTSPVQQCTPRDRSLRSKAPLSATQVARLCCTVVLGRQLPPTSSPGRPQQTGYPSIQQGAPSGPYVCASAVVASTEPSPAESGAPTDISPSPPSSGTSSSEEAPSPAAPESADEPSSEAPGPTTSTPAASVQETSGGWEDSRESAESPRSTVASLGPRRGADAFVPHEATAQTTQAVKPILIVVVYYSDPTAEDMIHPQLLEDRHCSL